jgi:hypothetical protein
MRVIFFVALSLLAAVPASAAELELGIRHLAMAPSGDSAFAGGELDVVSSRGFAATAEVFWTPRVSTQLAATFFNPAAILLPSNPPPNDLDLGTLGIDIYSLSGRYHWRSARTLSVFAGGGAAIVILGDLEDRFGDDIEMTLARETAFFVEGGVRYRVRPSIVFDAVVSYMPLEATPNFVRNDSNPRVALPPSVDLDPVTVSVGAAWRF